MGIATPLGWPSDGSGYRLILEYLKTSSLYPPGSKRHSKVRWSLKRLPEGPFRIPPPIHSNSDTDGWYEAIPKGAKEGQLLLMNTRSPRLHFRSQEPAPLLTPAKPSKTCLSAPSDPYPIPSFPPPSLMGGAMGWGSHGRGFPPAIIPPSLMGSVGYGHSMEWLGWMGIVHGAFPPPLPIIPPHL